MHNLHFGCLFLLPRISDMSYHTYAVVRGDLVRIWQPTLEQAEGLAASYRKLYPLDSDAWTEWAGVTDGEPDF